MNSTSKLIDDLCASPQIRRAIIASIPAVARQTIVNVSLGGAGLGLSMVSVLGRDAARTILSDAMLAINTNVEDH